MMAHNVEEAGRNEFLGSTKAGYILTLTVTVKFTRTQSRNKYEITFIIRLVDLLK
jgi:hypothetical protein